MRKMVVILSTAMLLLIIIGCSNKKVIKYDYIYRGENESWTAEYKINGTATFTEKDNKTSYEDDGGKVLTVTYKGDISELSSVKHFEISYKGEGLVYDIGDDDSLNQKTFTLESEGLGAVEDKDEIIKVNINMDGQTQTIELKNEQ